MLGNLKLKNRIYRLGQLGQGCWHLVVVAVRRGGVLSVEASHWTTELHSLQHLVEPLHENTWLTTYLRSVRTFESSYDTVYELWIKLPDLGAEMQPNLRGELWVKTDHTRYFPIKLTKCNRLTLMIRFRHVTGMLTSCQSQQDGPGSPKGIWRLPLRPHPAGQGWSSPGEWVDCGQWTSGTEKQHKLQLLDKLVVLLLLN